MRRSPRRTQVGITAGRTHWIHRHASTAGATHSTWAARQRKPWARSARTTCVAGRAVERARAAANQQSQANGALMRISPLGIWGTLRDRAELTEAARADAQLTHPHAVCQTASTVFAVTLAAAIRDGLSPRETHAFAVAWLRQHALDSEVTRRVEARGDRATHGLPVAAGLGPHRPAQRLLSTPDCADPRRRRRGHGPQGRRHRHQRRHLWCAPGRRPRSRGHSRSMAEHGPVVSADARPARRAPTSTRHVLAHGRTRARRTSASGLISTFSVEIQAGPRSFRRNVQVALRIWPHVVRNVQLPVHRHRRFDRACGTPGRRALGRAADPLSRHRPPSLQRFNGREVDTAGDGFFALFESDERGNPLRARHQTRRPRARPAQQDWNPYRCLSNWWRESQRIQRPRRGARDERRASRRDPGLGRRSARRWRRGALRLIDRGLHALKGLPGEWQLFAVAQTVNERALSQASMLCLAS